ncbi:MAG: hypothetical protein ACD_50C00208G0004 [uncultured bacterium]|nr:MAG: hypothetical protein ACD_50C00208G0004 [uncultured bacterium]
MKILGTGLFGLIGSRVRELLSDKYSFGDISIQNGIDITDKKRVFDEIKNSDASIVLHLAAKTSVDGCEKDKKKDIKILRYKDIKRQEEEWFKEKTAWAVNVYGTKNVVDACIQSRKKLIYTSTDFVFDGSKNLYSEEDKPNPINWYGRTKYEGEEIVKKSSTPWIIARIAYPYRANFIRQDFVRILIEKLRKKEHLQMVTDHVMSPTFVDDIAYALDGLIKNNSTGIFHVVGSEFITPYDAACKIAKSFGLEENSIAKTTRAEYFRNRAPRPFHLALKNDKIQSLGVKMRGLEEGLEEVKIQRSKFKITS